MGLDISHDAFSGAYSAFNRFRQAIARAAGGSFPPHDDKTLKDDLWYWGDGYGPQTHPGLNVFFLHSDCDGEIGPVDCTKLANELEPLLPALDAMGDGGGHLGHIGNKVRRFIDGCRLAASENESLEFA